MNWKRVIETGMLVFLLVAGIKLGQTWTSKALARAASGTGS